MDPAQADLPGAIYHSRLARPIQYIPGNMHWVLWWCHDMKRLCVLLALCEGNPLVTNGYSSQKASKVELWCNISVVSLSKLLNKQSRFWWIEPPRHSYDNEVTVMPTDITEADQADIYSRSHRKLTWFCCALLLWLYYQLPVIHVINLPIFLRVASLALAQSWDIRLWLTFLIPVLPSPWLYYMQYCIILGWVTRTFKCILQFASEHFSI